MPGRILIIEDNSANLELMVYLLRSFGHEIIAAEDGESGLEMAESGRPDAILCDIQLPGIDGYEVARRLMEVPALRAIPRVAVTAMAMVGDRDKLLAAGFDGYIGKPIQPETLVREVESFLPGGLASTPVRPAPGPGAPAPPERPERPRREGRALILVVDNLVENLELGRAILESAGYSVITANGASAALQIARRTPPALVLSDVDMPVRSGYDLLRDWVADAELRSIPFVFISSTSSGLRSVHRGEALGLSQVKFLVRPIEPEALLAEIELSLPKPDVREEPVNG
jgi:two-component system cell cycle response regulator